MPPTVSRPARLAVTASAAVVATAIFAGPAVAQAPAPSRPPAIAESSFKTEPPGLYASADLSYVLTSGNSSSSSLGFRGDLRHRFDRQAVGFSLAGIRASSSPDGGKYAVGTPEAFELRVPDAELTALEYFARARYDYILSDRLYVTGGVGWERNTFAGLDNRWVGDAGAGYVFVSNERTTFRGGAGLTYTSEDYTVASLANADFFGARLRWDYIQKLFSGTTLSHSLIFDQSLESSSDRRLDAAFGVHVAMTGRLGLKVNWRILHDNEPALTEVPLFAPGGGDTGITVLAPYKETDQAFSVSLVLSIAPPKP